MKIPLAIDGSNYSEAAISLIRALNIKPKPEVNIMTVIQEHVFLGGHTLADLLGRSATLKTKMRKAEEEKASESLAVRRLKVECKSSASRGSPS